MRVSIVSVVVLAIVPTGVSRAQEAIAPGVTAAAPILELDTPSVVFDDDGGRVEIVPPESPGPREIQYHGGPVIVTPHVRVVFLGDLWQAETHQDLKASIARFVDDFASSSDSRLGLYGVAGSGTSVVSASLDSAETISDLGIQAQLAKLLSEGTLEAPDADTLYVLFLPPGIASSLGEGKAGLDFLGYHSHFHAEAGDVRYVVVPADPSPERLFATTGKAMDRALINPDGDAWY